MMTTLHLFVARVHAYAMASVVNAHGGPSCCIHLAYGRTELKTEDQGALSRFEAFFSQRWPDSSLDIILQSERRQPNAGDIVDVTLGASFAHVQALDGVDAVRVSACNGEYTKMVWLHEGPEERQSTSEAEPLNVGLRIMLDALAYRPSGISTLDKKPVIALALLAQRTTLPCFALRPVPGGHVVTLDMPWAGKWNPEGDPRARVVTSGAKRKIIMNPETKAACALELHDPHDGGFWLEDVANVLLPFTFESEANTVVMRNVVIPQHDTDTQVKKGLGRFLNQRPNEPEVRIRAGGVLGFDPWHRSRFAETPIKHMLNALWRSKKAEFLIEMKNELLAKGGINEIDMILAQGGNLIPVELKHKRPELNDVRKLVAVARRTNRLRPTNLEAWLIHTFRPDDLDAWRDEKEAWERMYPGLRVMHVFDDLLPNLPFASFDDKETPLVWRGFPYDAWIATPSPLQTMPSTEIDVQSVLKAEQVALTSVIRYVLQGNTNHLYQPLLGIDLLSNPDAIIVDLDKEGWRNFKSYGEGILKEAVAAWKSGTPYAERSFVANFIDRPSKEG
jgi:hypothetical protein